MITNNSNYPVEKQFDINANTRSITVPADFLKNGVGVIGDDLAEALEFSISRYFDGIDLGAATKIEILYVNAANQSGKYNATSSKSSDPENLNFTWVLQKEHIGAKSGNLKFSVRITIGSVVLNTQVQTVAIKSGLELGSIIAESDGANALSLRSNLTPDTYAQAPVFATNLPASAGLGNLTIALDGDVADYGDAIKAVWYKDGAVIAGANGKTYNVTTPGSYQVVLTSSKKVVDEKITDIDGNANVEFKVHTSINSTSSNVCVVGAPKEVTITKNLDADVNATSMELQFTQPTEGTITAKVMYRAALKQADSANEGQMIDVVATEKSSATITDGKVTIPVDADGYYSVKLIHTLNGGSKDTLSAEAHAVLDPVTPTVTIEPEGDGELGTTTLSASVSNLAALNTVTYQWSFKDSVRGTLAPIAGATAATYKPADVEDGGKGSGYYAVEVTNTKPVGKVNKTAKGNSSAKKVS